MKKYALYNPSNDQYVSYLLYNRKTKTYVIEYTRSVYSIRFWNLRSSAEAQAQRVFDWNRNVALEVHELK